jgi:hypothetical protein
MWPTNEIPLAAPAILVFLLRILKSVRLVNALEQLSHINLERTGELHDVFHPHVAMAAFDPADVRCVHPGFFGKFFLRPFSFQS